MPVARKQTAKKPVKKSGGRRVPKTGILSRIETPEFSDDDPLVVAVFGKPTTGKTTFACSFPGRILYVSCSGGLNKPGELKSLSKETLAKIDLIRIKNCEDLNSITEEVAMSEPHTTVVLDHLTSFSDLVLEEVTGKPVPAQLSWGYAKQQEWGKHGALVKSFLRNLIDTGKNTVIVCHERVFEPPEDSTLDLPTVIGPACTPTIANWLTGTIDYSIQMFLRAKTIDKTVTINKKTKIRKIKTDEMEFCSYLPLAEGRMTKFRKPIDLEIPTVVVDLDYNKLSAIIKE